MIEPIHAMPTATFSMEIKAASEEGITSFLRIWNFVAPIERRSRILLGSVARNAESMCMMTTMIPTAIAINTIAFDPVPNQMMMSGPSAILGSAFKTTMYGSSTLWRRSFHQKARAMIHPSATATTSPMRVSSSVTPM